MLWNGLGVFWPHPIYEVTLADGTKLLGELVDTETDPITGKHRVKYHVGNREEGAAFRWIDEEDIVATGTPPEAVKLDRMVNLNYFGYLRDIKVDDLEIPEAGSVRQRLSAAIGAAHRAEDRAIEPLAAEESRISQEINDHIENEKIEVKYRRRLLLRGGAPPDTPELARLDARLEELAEVESRLKAESHEVTRRRTAREAEFRKNVALFESVTGKPADAGPAEASELKPIALVDIVRCTTPNSMGTSAKIRHYLVKVWELVSAGPREANQDGGVFPAIFGTVLLVILMAITCFPLGVLAGIYLGEYAKEGPLVRLVRVAVNNLAGIPSIVYGIFGLGFFVYWCGGTLDALLYPARVDASKPVFGQGCILWASLTLGLLTIPVVIVSTEEALRAIPRAVREGSYALGATKLQTLSRVLLPMASPGVMTGFILAMARAVGEVAPLMITGAVKSAPLPVSGDFPFVRLDRQFMHLGFHIFDISCKSPNVEATKPLVYVTTLLLLAIVLTLTSTAIWLRNRMRRRYQVRSM